MPRITERGRFVWGFVGGITLELLRMSSAFKLRGSFTFAWHEVIASAIFGMCAGLFTMAWAPESKLKAWWAGMSFPSILSAFLSKLPPLPP